MAQYFFGVSHVLKFLVFRYTPAESAALGIPTVTSNLSGFGRYLEDVVNKATRESMGLFVIDR
jgi:glycogen(starch) synthase